MIIIDIIYYTDIPNITAYEKNGLTIIFAFERDPLTTTTVNITLTATNSSVLPFTDFVFQAAVPKVLQIMYVY